MCPNESKIEVRGKSTRDPILCPSPAKHVCNYEAKRHSPTCFGMQPNHGGCLLCCYTGYLGIFSSFLV